jgi:4-amino-4-deoxy-L-arabinose transferase-like glycosyltransferase
MTASPGTPSLTARRHVVVGFLVLLLALALRLFGLPSTPVFDDDQQAAVSGINYVERGQVGPQEWHHPRGPDLLEYAVMLAFGESKLAVVLPSLLFGVFGVALLALLGLQLTGEPAVALLAAFLLAVDPVHVDFSRQGVREGWPLFFVLAGTCLALRHHRTGGRLALLAAGAVLGFGAACKWSVAFAAIALLVWLAWQCWADRATPGWRAELAFRFAALVLVPAAVYLATWAPWLAGGRDLADLVELHLAVGTEQLMHRGNSAYQSIEGLDDRRAWLWFVKPVSWSDFQMTSSGPVALIAISNPVVWLLTLPAMGWLAVRGWRERRPLELLWVALFASTWLSLVWLPRPVFLTAAFATLPFALLGVAWLALRLSGRLGRAWLVAWLALVLLAAAPLYLLATGEADHVGPLGALIEHFRPVELEGGGGR